MACPSKSLTCTNASKTVWPSGLRRWLQAPVRKGVGSNPTAVTFPVGDISAKKMWEEKEATARGFEPLRAAPNGFLVHHLNHSVTLSMEDVEQVCQDAFSMLGVRSCARARPTWRAPPAQSLPRQCHWPRVLQLAAGKPSFLLLSSKATLETGSYLLYCGLLASLRGTSRSDSEGIRTPAGRAQWISCPSP